MAPAQKAALVDAWSADVAALVGVRRRHPHADVEEIRFQLGRLLLGDAVAQKVRESQRTRRS